MRDKRDEHYLAMQAMIGGLACFGLGAEFMLLIQDRVTTDSGTQVLFAAILASITALFSVMAIIAQIRQTENSEVEQRSRANLRARAAISQPLSNLVAYQQTCIDTLRTIPIPSSRSSPLAAYSVSFLPFPSDDVGFLVDCIETAESRDADSISLFVSKLQVQFARLESLAMRLRNPMSGRVMHSISVSDVDSHILLAIELSARAQGLIPYARREQSVGDKKPSFDAVLKSFRLCGFDEEEDDELFKSLKRYYDT